jgi:hypothetical protein
LVALEKEIFAVSMVKFFKEGQTYGEECASGFFYEQSGNLCTICRLLVLRQLRHATPYSQPFRGRQGFLIDSQLHNGTSGSPVLAKPTTFIRNFNGRAELVHDRIKSFKKYPIGVHS